MWRLIIFLLLLAGAAVGLAWLTDHPGEISVVWLGHRIETSVLIALAALLVATVVLSMLWGVLRLALRSPSIFNFARTARRRRRGYEALTRGMVAAGAGDTRTARKAAAEVARHLPHEPLGLVLHAQVAQLAGDRGAAEAAFTNMAKREETRLLGLRGLHIEAHRRGDAEAAHHFAREAHRAAALPWAGEAVVSHHASQADWAGALATVEANARAKTIDAKTAERQRAVLETAIAQENELVEPERALKLAQQAVGPVHVAADIGCHALATFEPFSSGHSILGYGMSLASRAGVTPMMQRRVLSVMGDGGFWHNGLLTGVQSALFNGDDAVLVIMKNGYTSATGTQEIISTPDDAIKEAAEDKQQSLVHRNETIEKTLKGLGVQWLRTVDTYDVAKMRRTFDDAFTTPFAGLKVIIAEGECQLERQRRTKPWIAGKLKRGERVVRVKYGVDEDVCNGDHACIRLSGCPTLTLKDNPDPLKVDPVATVIDGCVGCGLCGENAHAATLCPSFYRAEVVRNPKWHERLAGAVRGAVQRVLQPA